MDFTQLFTDDRLMQFAMTHTLLLWFLREVVGIIVKYTSWKWDDELMNLLKDGKNARVAMNYKLDKFNKWKQENATKTTGGDT